MAERAARLAKADLVTGMVGEFPELQGLMGGYYAAAQGEPPEVAAAVRDHYKPVGQGDEVPTAPVTVAVSLADKLDTIAAFFAIDAKPTGSKDPFALRRARSDLGDAYSKPLSGNCRGMANWARQLTCVKRLEDERSEPRPRRASTRAELKRQMPVVRPTFVDFLRRPPQSPAARSWGPARPDRRGVCAGGRGRSRPFARPRSSVAGVRDDRGRHEPARRLQTRGEYPEEGGLCRGRGKVAFLCAGNRRSGADRGARCGRAARRGGRSSGRISRGRWRRWRRCASRSTHSSRA